MSVLIAGSPSGSPASRVVDSGSLTIPAGSQISNFGPTLTRFANERCWVFVFPVTDIPAAIVPIYLIVGFSAKTDTMTAGEWAPVVFNVIGAAPFDIVVDYTAFATVRRHFSL